MCYLNIKIKALGEYSPDDDWWGKCKKVPCYKGGVKKADLFVT